MGEMVRLVRAIQKLFNETLQIDLKNGTIIQGTLVGLDTVMNCHIKSAIIISLNGSTDKVDVITIRGNQLRSIILPERINIDTLLIGIDVDKKGSKNELRLNKTTTTRFKGRWSASNSLINEIAKK